MTAAGKKKTGSASASGIAALGAAGKKEKEEEEEQDLTAEQRRGDCREGGWDQGCRQSKGATISTGRESAKPRVRAALWQQCETCSRSGGGHVLAEPKLRPDSIRFIHRQQPAGPTGLPFAAGAAARAPRQPCGALRAAAQTAATSACGISPTLTAGPTFTRKAAIKNPLKSKPSEDGGLLWSTKPRWPVFYADIV